MDVLYNGRKCLSAVIRTIIFNFFVDVPKPGVSTQQGKQRSTSSEPGVSTQQSTADAQLCKYEQRVCW